MQFATFGLAKRMAVAFGALVFLFAGAFAQGFSFIGPSSNAPAAAPDAVVVMPFENRSQIAKYNWICDSFAILIVDVLDAHGVSVINVDKRNLAFEKLRLSPSDLLTRAAMIRVAGAAQANLALVGEFDIGESKESVTISITARLIETREGGWSAPRRSITAARCPTCRSGRGNWHGISFTSATSRRLTRKSR